MLVKLRKLFEIMGCRHKHCPAGVPCGGYRAFVPPYAQGCDLS